VITVQNPDHPDRGAFVPTGIPDLERVLDNPGLPVGKPVHLYGPGAEGLLRRMLSGTAGDGFSVLTFPRDFDQGQRDPHGYTEANRNRKLIHSIADWIKAMWGATPDRTLIVVDPGNRAGKGAHFASYVRLEARDDGTGKVIKNCTALIPADPEFRWDQP